MLAFLFLISTGCNKNEDENSPDGGTEPAKYSITLKFSPVYKGKRIDLDTMKYTNAAGNRHSITRLRFLVSRVALARSEGGTSTTDAHHLAQIAPSNGLPLGNKTMRFTLPQKIQQAEITSLSFNYGFNEQDNTTNAYPELNQANWNWPEHLGGGYHHMQFEGRFQADSGGVKTFNFHMGTARDTTGPDTTFVNNHVPVTLDGADFKLDQNVTVEVIMHLDQWFENPRKFDMDDWPAALMPNYDAQLLMHDNAHNVFSVGKIE